MAQEKEIQVLATNKKAYYQYHIVDKFKAGIVLTGTEVKSARARRISFNDAHCAFKNGELWLRNVHIAEYKYGSIHNHEPKSDRKLLLQKRELRRLQSKVKEKGFTIVPIEFFLNERALVKVEIALVKGKNTYSKKQSIKEKDQKRDMARAMKDY